MNTKKITQLIRELLCEIGEDPKRKGLHETPTRVAQSYEKLFEGYRKNSKDCVKVFRNEGSQEMIIIKDITFYSTCEHHLLPFYGHVSIGYLPQKAIIGLSKVPRIVELYARRLQNQERLTKQISDTLSDILHPRGIGVLLKGEHLCMKARGVEKHESTVITSSWSGSFLKNIKVRNEFITLIT